MVSLLEISQGSEKKQTLNEERHLQSSGCLLQWFLDY